MKPKTSKQTKSVLPELKPEATLVLKTEWTNEMVGSMALLIDQIRLEIRESLSILWDKVEETKCDLLHNYKILKEKV